MMVRIVTEEPPFDTDDPPASSGRWLKRLSLFILLACICTGGVITAVFTSYLGRPSLFQNDANVIIPAGAGRVVISARLNSAGLDHPEWVMRLEEIRRGKTYVPKAGEYHLPKGTSLTAAMDILHAGNTVQHSFTIPEGHTVRQVLDQLYGDDKLTGLITPIPIEGSLLPETYFFERGAKRNDLILRMQQSQELSFAALWAERAEGLPVTTLKDAIILASIVEKETGQDSERTLVASVFINRLNKNMKLQSDPTTLYGLVQSGTPVKKLLRRHLDHDSLWNTYKYKGLPPTPITNPGRESLAAVLNPAVSDYLYFVANGDGGHNFAKTLDEHNKNVRIWRKIQKSRE